MSKSKFWRDAGHPVANNCQPRNNPWLNAGKPPTINGVTTHDMILLRTKHINNSGSQVWKFLTSAS